MWLLNVHSRKLEHFIDDREAKEKKYAILSHTWDEQEVTFGLIHSKKAKQMKGHTKIQYTCQQAKEDGLDYVWIDTCCINKDSSAELTEAINSIYRWYRNSAICYVYLADVQASDVDLSPWQARSSMTREHQRESPFRTQLYRSRWFTRGWTLQ